MICDAHCHFFSATFFRTLARDLTPAAPGEAAEALPARLGWDPPGEDTALAERWIAELDKHQVARAMLIASVPGDEQAVAAAVSRHPSRFVGAFMFNPSAPDAASRLDRAFEDSPLTTVCLFPAMHHVRLDDPAVDAVFAAAARRRRVVFVHCGCCRSASGRSSACRAGSTCVSAIRCGGCGRPSSLMSPSFRTWRGLLPRGADGRRDRAQHPADTSSSNNWIRYQPGLTLADVFAPRAGRGRTRASALWHRLVLFPPRLAARDSRDPARNPRPPRRRRRRSGAAVWW